MASITHKEQIRERIRQRAMGYWVALIFPALMLVALLARGVWSWVPVIYAFAVVPFIELFMRPDHRSLDAEEQEVAAKEPMFDLLLYAIVPIHWALMLFFLHTVAKLGEPSWEMAGLVLSMGLQCGIYGINVAHELGHRRKRSERYLARILLLSSLYMHFIIEHNRGHHHRVGTPQDPASARYGESVYAFWWRSIIFSAISAWQIERQRLQGKGSSMWHLRNEMLQAIAIQTALVLTVGSVFGWLTLMCFLLAALGGILLLETVNYIEHYGLGRHRRSSGGYGKVELVHSWNSDHRLGRWMLFELTRHSDHHYKASKKYQLLNGTEEGPHLPTGYPGSMLLALVPPLWKRIMHPRIIREQGIHPSIRLATNA